MRRPTFERTISRRVAALLGRFRRRGGDPPMSPPLPFERKIRRDYDDKMLRAERDYDDK